jgi:hypothetical protein
MWHEQFSLEKGVQFEAHGTLPFRDRLRENQPMVLRGKTGVGIKRQNHVSVLSGKTLCRVTGALGTGVCSELPPTKGKTRAC